MQLSTKKKIHDILAREGVTKSWKARIAKLPTSCRQFCIKHKIATAQINRYKNMKELPSWKVIRKIEKAFKKAGV